MRLVRRGRAVAAVAAAVLGGASLTGCGAPSADGSSCAVGPGSRVGDGTATLVPVSDRCPAPVLRGQTLDGAPLDLSDFRGSVVVLNVWGSWCAPCKKEQPDLQRAAEVLARDGVRFVGINVRDSSKPNARAHVRRYGVTYPSLFDPSASLVARFRDLPPSAIPSTIVIDGEGRVAARMLGATTYDELLLVVGQVT
ncbi:MAG TPA: TlpA disulfide reductase family protein [Mycobacteriales bacterium]|nr:TlpA disulfide reductase family protein [Mycobacteriales bacterium]